MLKNMICLTMFKESKASYRPERVPECVSFVFVYSSVCVFQGEWGVTAEQEAEENRRVQEFKDTIPKMCSQLRLLTHFYQVP